MIYRTLSIILLLFISNLLIAQEYITSVNHYDLEDGLSHNQINWVFQDSRGMIWVGAANGINRYDGKEFKLVTEVDFFYTENSRIFEDQEKDLWLIRNRWDTELFFFNTETEQVKTFEEKFKTSPPFKPHDFYSVIELMDKTLIIRTRSGQLFSYNNKGEFNLIAELKYKKSEVIGLPETSDFWVLGKHLMLMQKEQEGTFTKRFSHKLEKYQTYLGFTKQNAILIRDSSTIYQQYNTDGTIQKLKFSDDNKQTTYQEYIYDSNKDHFFSFEDGLLKIIPRQGQQSSIQSNVTKSLGNFQSNEFLLKDDVYWISNMYGLTKLQIKPDAFKRMAYKNPANYENSDFESCRLIRDYIKDEKYDNLPDFRNKDKFLTYYIDDEERVWLGGNYGLYYLEKGDKRATLLKSSSGPASHLKGLVYQIYKDNDQQLWVISANGLFRFSPSEGLTQRYSADDPNAFLPSVELRHMYQDAAGIYWIGSYDGLIRWDKKNNQHRLFTTKDGLSNNHIMAVYEDEFGFLWLSSDNGIMQFEKSTNRVKTYLPKDGITYREFNRAAHFKNENGVVYFGSLNGITYFHPKDFVDRFYEVPDTPLLLTECTLLSADTKEHENRMEDWLQNKKITIQPGDQNLQLKFALLDYENNNPNALQYVYSMNGSDSWNIGNGNVLSFNGLAYGEHLLKVKGRTGNGLFSNQELIIPITVLKPFYLQNWFLGLSVLSFIAGLFFLQKIKTRSLLKRQELLENEVQQRTKTIQAQAEELRQLDKAKSRFLANISHEFRTPLTIILNSLNKDDLNKLTEQDAQIMRRNAGRLQQLINQLLDLSKLEAGKMTLQLTNENFNFYLKNLIESFEPLAEKAKLSLEFQSTLEHTDYQFDRDKIDKIVYNLLSNAIKFTPEEGVVSVNLFRENQNICIQVRDSGIGIPDLEQPKVFDRFYQVNKDEDFSYEGTGLGLALVQELVEVHQGHIELKSELGQGTCFKVFLPLIPAEVTDDLSIERKLNEKGIVDTLELPTQLITDDVSTSHPLLLLIEDNEDLLYHYQKTFSGNFNLLSANNGDEGLVLAMEHIPDIIICDVMMPGKNGYEVCEILKTDEKTNHIPLILLTAKAGQESKIKGLSFGANEYLTKPFDQKELELRINNLLKQRSQLQQRFQNTNQSISSTPKALTPQEQFIEKCSEIIESQITNRNFGVEELSRELNMSRTHLFRKLKSITGITPTIFIRKYRLEKAKNLLSQYAGNGSEISYMVGFSNPNYFFKCFKDEYGMTVGEFFAQISIDA